MAVTTWIVRLGDEARTRASSDPAWLDAICSREALPADDTLDLDWAPRSFDRAAGRAGLSREALATLARATEGNREVIPGHRGFNSQYESPTYLDPQETRDVSATLEALDPVAILGHLIADDNPGADLGSLRAELIAIFVSMQTFYREAAALGRGIISFLD